MRRLLLSPAAPDALTRAVLEDWQDAFDPAECRDFDALIGRYDLVLPADSSLGDPVRLPASGEAGLALAFLCRTPAAVDRAAPWAEATGADILFVPSRLAILDRWLALRETLVAGRHLSRGHRLSPADLGHERGGPGLPATAGPELTGRRLLYDLAAGQPIDFGMIAPDPDPAKAGSPAGNVGNAGNVKTVGNTGRNTGRGVLL